MTALPPCPVCGNAPSRGIGNRVGCVTITHTIVTDGMDLAEAESLWRKLVAPLLRVIDCAAEVSVITEQEEIAAHASLELLRRAAAVPQTSPSEAEFMSAVDSYKELISYWDGKLPCPFHAAEMGLLGLFRAAASRPDDSWLIAACEAWIHAKDHEFGDWNANSIRVADNNLRTALARAKEQQP